MFFTMSKKSLYRSHFDSNLNLKEFFIGLDVDQLSKTGPWLDPKIGKLIVTALG